MSVMLFLKLIVLIIYLFIDSFTVLISFLVLRRAEQVITPLPVGRAAVNCDGQSQGSQPNTPSHAGWKTFWGWCQDSRCLFTQQRSKVKWLDSWAVTSSSDVSFGAAAIRGRSHTVDVVNSCSLSGPWRSVDHLAARQSGDSVTTCLTSCLTNCSPIQSLCP